jgi:hypothetical protein
MRQASMLSKGKTNANCSISGSRPEDKGAVLLAGKKPKPPLPQDRESGYDPKNAKNKCRASFLVAPISRGLRSAPLVRHDVMPNPSFKGEAQRHGTLAIKRRGLRPILRLLSSAPRRRAPP